MMVIGVDPGLSGSIAFYDWENKKLVHVQDLPMTTIKDSKKKYKRRSLDAYALATLIDASSKEVSLAVIEDVSAMTYTDQYGHVRGQGAASSFAFGKVHGQVLGILAACMIPMAMVRPAVWKTLMGLSRDKDLSRTTATKLFPGWNRHWQRKKDDGRAESALLAYFGAERLLGKSA